MSGNPTNRVLQAESRMRIGNSRFRPELFFISFKNSLADVGDAEHRNGRDDSRPLGMIRKVHVNCSGGDLNRHRAEVPRLRCGYSSRLERRVRATFAPLPSGSSDGRDRPQGLL